ncbi:MAG: gliding motility-associated lipoprotein GldH [Arenicella sp.]|jgi:gliding motility-associated lipoprotein GldH
MISFLISPFYFLFSARKSLTVLSLVFLFASCQEKAIYNQYADLDDGNWELNSLIDFEFEIENASKPVNLFYNIRNDVSYPFYNLYVKYELTDPNGKILRSNMHEANLMDPTTGAPIGTGESLFDNQILLLKNFQFPESGKYKFSIKQYMREEKIEGIWAVGLTIKDIEK